MDVAHSSYRQRGQPIGRNASMVYPHIQYQGPAYPNPLFSENPAYPNPLFSDNQANARELDSRVSDGIHVCLLWYPDDGHVSVAVYDSKTGEAFELPVGHEDRALDVYRHPYAYASRRSPSAILRAAAEASALELRD